MVKKLFRYRGRRVRYWNRCLILYYKIAFLLPAVGIAGYFFGYGKLYPLIETGTKDWLLYVTPVCMILSIVLGDYLLSSLFIRASIQICGYFLRVEQRQTLARLIIDNGYYTVKKVKTNDKKTKEKVKFPKIYYKYGKYSVFISFETAGNKFQEKFESIGGFLETAFHGDIISEVDEKGFVVYELAVEVFKERIPITHMQADKGKVQLMRGLYWHFDKDPHLLLGGGTGGGKTFTLLSLIYALCRVGDIEICDPKNSDLMALNKIPLFSGKVHTGKEDIVNCLKNTVDLMNERFEMMNNSEKYKMGKNYAYYDLKPKFVIIDEFAAFRAEIGSDYKTDGEVDEYLTQLILKARQCGIFFVVAMQRPDGEFIKTALRDQFMFRMSVGRLSETGILMIFGDENKNKKFKYVEKINGLKVYGRGYVARGGEIAREFYSPQVPDNFDFINEFVKINDEFGYPNMMESEVQEISDKIEQTFDRNALAESMEESEEKKLINSLSQKY